MSSCFDADRAGERGNVEVTLYCSQQAVVNVTVPEGADPYDEAILLDLALRALDESGGAQWVTVTAYIDGTRHLTPEATS